MKCFLSLLMLFFSLKSPALTTGTAAPDFSLPGLNSTNVSLSDFKGKIVILEWLNHGCPFVKKHYNSGHMQKLQKKYTDQNAVWLSVISSAPGKQGYVSAKEAAVEKKEKKSQASNILLDSDGKVGKLYGAKTTPHMYIIDKKGKLLYQGAIDDKADTDLTSIASAKNYIVSAMDEIMAGKEVIAHTTRAYGCSIKFAD